MRKRNRGEQMNNTKIKKLRNLVDKTDKEIICLLEKRFRLAKNIIKIKKNNKIPIEDLNREKEIIRKLLKSKPKVPAGCIREIFKSLFKYTKKIKFET